MTADAPSAPISLRRWITIVLISLGLVVVLAVAGGLAFMHVLGSAIRGSKPSIRETRISDPATGLVLIKKIERFKGVGNPQLITLAISAPGTGRQPFALYQRETRASFRWDHGQLSACVTGQGYGDKDAYWNDRVTIPNYGAVQIIKTCPGPQIIPSSQAAP